MLYKVETEIFDDFPRFARGVVIATGIDNESSSIPELELLLRASISEVEESDAISLKHPRIQAWYAAYQHFGVKRVRDTSPSIATLVKRIKRGKGGDIPFISPLVAISNLIALKYLVPSGGIDAETIQGDLILGKAVGNETFVPLGRDEVLSPNPGEVIYYDKGTRNVICRAWNSKAGRSTVITRNTQRALIDVDGMLDVIPLTELQEATQLLASLVQDFCGGSARIEYLTPNHPEFMVPKG